MRGATDSETIRLQIYNIDRKLQLANMKRENKNKEVIDHAKDYKNKLNTIKSTKEALLSQSEWETMNKVILKHHEKDVKMKKKAKESKEVFNYE